MIWVVFALCILTIIAIAVLEIYNLKKMKEMRDKYDTWLRNITDQVVKNYYENKSRIDKVNEHFVKVTEKVNKVQNILVEATTKKTTKKKKEETTNVPVQNDQENDSGK